MSSVSPSTTPTGLWSSSARASTRSSVRNSSVDPPRPAEDGYQWVWFPEGYWAERPVERRASSKGLISNSVDPIRPVGSLGSSFGSVGSVGKLFKRRGESNNSLAGLIQAEQRDLSPSTVLSPLGSRTHFGQSNPGIIHPQSPWLSEEAHVQSLQHPMSLGITHRDDEDTWNSPQSVRRVHPLSVPIAVPMSPGEKKKHLPWVKYSRKVFHIFKVVKQCFWAVGE